MHKNTGMNAKGLEIRLVSSHARKLVENGENKGESDEEEGLGRRGEEGTKEKDDERAVATGPQGCSAASCVFVVELMTGLRSQKTTGISALLPGFIHPRSSLGI